MLSGVWFKQFRRYKNLLEIVGKHVYEKKFYVDDLSEEEQEEYKDWSEEDLEEEGIIYDETVVE